MDIVKLNYRLDATLEIRERAMPGEEVWDGFFDAPAILDRLGLNDGCHLLLEFGCGYGTFTIPAARTISGTVHALDIEADMLEKAQQQARSAGLDNIRFVQRDFVAKGSGLIDRSVDYAMIFNILHLEDPVALLREAY